jgi:hypothetical protein
MMVASTSLPLASSRPRSRSCPLDGLEERGRELMRFEYESFSDFRSACEGSFGNSQLYCDQRRSALRPRTSRSSASAEKMELAEYGIVVTTS